MMISCLTGTAARTAATLMLATTAVMASGGLVSVYAQNDTQNEIDERLLACADIGDTADRMACFDEVVQGLKQGADSPEVANIDSTAAPPVPAAVESPSEVSAPLAAGAAATSVPAASAGAAATESSNASPPAESKNAGFVETLPNTTVDEFGLGDQIARAEKQEKKRKEKENEVDSFRATIVQSEKSGSNFFVVMLDNGQVWEETDGSTRRIGLPRVGMPVEISKGLFGSYRMKIGDDNRVARVRRLK